MQIIHHGGWTANDAQIAQLLSLGFDADAPHGLLVLDIDEADQRWPTVKALMPADALEMVYTRATDDERSAATWLVMEASGHHGYPQPEDDFGYLHATYQVDAYCPKCGVGASQRAAFRFRRDPALRTGRVLQLNWVFDAFFTAPATWEQVFRPLGVVSRPAVLHRTGEVLSSLVQLEAPPAPAPLGMGDHGAHTCERCGRAKYRPFTRGFLPAFAGPAPTAHLVQSREVFGSGGSAYRQTMVSANLYRAVRAAKIRGVTFMPTMQHAPSEAR